MNEIEQILTTGEELPMEDQKKAINMQDLVYVKRYIDKRQNDYEAEMDSKHTTFKDDVNTDNSDFRDEMRASYTEAINANNDFKTHMIFPIIVLFRINNPSLLISMYEAEG